MSITGQEGGTPTRVGTSVGDIVPGLFSVIGIMMALYNRTFTGQGQYLDISMMDSLVAILENAIMRYQVTKEVPGPIGNRHPHITPFDSFTVRDGYIVIGAGNPSLFEKLCNILGLPELYRDERFSETHIRHQNHNELKEILNQGFSKRSMADALAKLEEAGIPCAPINTIDRLMTDPQIKAREMLVEVDHPAAGKIMLSGIPIKMSGTPGAIEAPAPMLGQHTDSVLQKFIGLQDNQIQSLRAKGVIK